jgi:hypothetical protein
MKTSRASVGKIACLPYAIREQVNQRLLNGQRGPAILSWLNSLKAVQKVLAAQFKGKPIKSQNLSEWRQCGFKRWVEENQLRLDMKKRDGSARRYARAARNLAAGAAAIAADKLFQALESGEITSTEDVLKILPSIIKLLKADQYNVKLKHDQIKLRQRDEQLQLMRDKHQRDVIAIGRRMLDDERSKIIQFGPFSNEEKIEMLGLHIFGELWVPRHLPTSPKSPGASPAAPKPAPAGEAGSSRSSGRESAPNNDHTPSPSNHWTDGTKEPDEMSSSSNLARSTAVPSPGGEAQGSSEQSERQLSCCSSVGELISSPSKFHDDNEPDTSDIPIPQITPGKTTQQLIAEIEDYAVEVALARKARSPLAGSSGRQSALNENEKTVSPAASALDANQSKIENPNSKIPKVPLSDYDKALSEGKSHLEALYAQFTPTPEELERRKRANEELRHPTGVPIYEPPTAQQTTTPNPQKIYGPCPSPYTWQGHRTLDNWKVHTS